MAARKTAKQRAQEELDLAERIQERAEKRNTTATEDLERYEERHERLLAAKTEERDTAATALQEANDRVAFLKTHPALNDGEDGLL
jgi:hypothetical protein